MPSAYNATTNVWGYSTTSPAQLNNTFALGKTWDVIDTLTSWTGGWIVYQSWSSTTQIWSKWVIDSSILSKQYLSQELVDPSLKDIKVWNDKTFKDYWVWKYVYWVYAKSNFTPTSKKWQAYNVAVTLTDDQKWYLTKIIWNFDASTCSNCPDSLIWSGTAWINLKDWNSSMTGSYLDSNERIPYPVDWF